MGEPAGGGTLETNLEEHMLRGREVIAPHDCITKFLPEGAFPVQTTKLSRHSNISRAAPYLRVRDFRFEVFAETSIPQKQNTDNVLTSFADHFISQKAE